MYEKILYTSKKTPLGSLSTSHTRRRLRSRRRPPPVLATTSSGEIQPGAGSLSQAPEDSPPPPPPRLPNARGTAEATRVTGIRVPPTTVAGTRAPGGRPLLLADSRRLAAAQRPSPDLPTALRLQASSELLPARTKLPQSELPRACTNEPATATVRPRRRLRGRPQPDPGEC